MVFTIVDFTLISGDNGTVAKARNGCDAIYCDCTRRCSPIVVLDATLLSPLLLEVIEVDHTIAAAIYYT